MQGYDYIILGAGPSGLAFACSLMEWNKKGKESSFLLLEEEKEAGGLCKSRDVDGTPLDTGGGHFLDVRRPQADEFLFRYMPREEWNLYHRDSRIVLHGQTISYPIEANIWQLAVEEQVEYLKSIAVAGSNLKQPIPEKFIDWIYWKLGERIADEYMLPYNRKLYGEDLDQLGTYWLDKLPNVSFDETLLSCLNRRAYGENPGHTDFLYPKKHGFGEVWLRMADSIKEHICYTAAVRGIDFEHNEVTTADGKRYKGRRIITTIPWNSFTQIKGMPEPLEKSIHMLKDCAIVVDYQQERMDTDAHWIYYPDKEVNYHRILVRHNFCAGSKGIWTETNAARFDGLFTEHTFYNRYAYPLNTIDKPQIMKELLTFAKSRNVYGLGRWGEHQHYNSDAVVESAMKLAESLAGQ